MSYAQLKAFHALALEGSLHKAAERLSLTQPAVSIHIKTLERDNAKSLFRRAGHRLQLTEDGAALFEATQRLFRAERDARLILAAPQGQARGSLLLGADGPHVALDLIARFQARTPGIQVQAVLANAEETWANLLELKVDAAVLAGSPDDPRVVKQVLARQGLVALLPRSHALARKRRLRLEQLADQPLIFRESGSSTQRRLAEGLLAQRLSVQPALILGSREAVFEAVVRGLGIGFAYDREVGCDPRLSAVPIEGFDAANIDHLACLKAQRHAPAVTALFDCAPSADGDG